MSIKANIIEIDAGCVWNTGPSEVQEFFRAGKFYKDYNMFLKAEPTCAHHDNVSIKVIISSKLLQVVCGIQDLLISKEFSEQESSIIRITTCSWKQNRHVHITTTCRSRLISSKLMQVVCGIQNLLKSKEFSEQESSVNYMFLKAEPTCAHHDNVSIKADIIENDAGCVWN